MDEAKRTLVRVVDNFKNLYGKSELDQSKLISEDHQKLVWFVFPSEVLSELMSLRGQNFNELEKYNQERSLPEVNGINIPFIPLDYTKGETHAFAFSREYLESHNQPVPEESKVSPVKSAAVEEQKVQPIKQVVRPEVEEEQEFGGMGDFTEVDQQDKATAG